MTHVSELSRLCSVLTESLLAEWGSRCGSCSTNRSNFYITHTHNRLLRPIFSFYAEGFSHPTPLVPLFGLCFKTLALVSPLSLRKYLLLQPLKMCVNLPEVMTDAFSFFFCYFFFFQSFRKRSQFVNKKTSASSFFCRAFPAFSVTSVIHNRSSA